MKLQNLLIMDSGVGGVRKIPEGTIQEMTFTPPACASNVVQAKGFNGMRFDDQPNNMDNQLRWFRAVENGNEKVSKRKIDGPREEDDSSANVRSSKVCTRGHWRPHEDAKLRELVSKFGPQNWNLIAEKLDGRSGKSCRLRWFNQLDPRINRRAFTEEDEEKLFAAHAVYGNKWAMISRLFPGRTDNAVKNHWHVIMARKHREQNSVYRRRKHSSSAAQLGQLTHVRSESSISSNGNNKDGCNESTCTDLSLTPSSVKAPHFLSRFSPMINHQNLLNSNNGDEDEKRALIMGTIEINDSNNQSDSNANSSEVSASGSVVAASQRSNFYICEKGNKIAFIDFLGVGST